MPTNEAAERLLVELQENPLAGARHAYTTVDAQLPKVLAAERRATVERIYQAALSNSTEIEQRAFNALRVILDEEAAR